MNFVEGSSGPKMPANNIKELIDLARASPGKLNVASPGVGTPNHLGAAQLMTLTGIELVHVPYKGLMLPESVQRFEKNGLQVATTTPQEFHDMIRTDLQMWNKLLKDAKISVDSLP